MSLYDAGRRLAASPFVMLRQTEIDRDGPAEPGKTIPIVAAGL